MATDQELIQTVVDEGKPEAIKKLRRDNPEFNLVSAKKYVEKLIEGDMDNVSANMCPYCQHYVTPKDLITVCVNNQEEFIEKVKNPPNRDDDGNTLGRV